MRLFSPHGHLLALSLVYISFSFDISYPIGDYWQVDNKASYRDGDEKDLYDIKKNLRWKYPQKTIGTDTHSQLKSKEAKPYVQEY
jgi:hypothetical protein